MENVTGGVYARRHMAVAFPAMHPGDPVRISASTFVAWKKCPGSAEARLQGHYPPDTRASFTGSLAHLIFARHLSDGPIADESFAQACREEIGDSNLNFKMGGLDLGRMTALQPLISEVRDLYARFVRFPADGFAGSEVELFHELADDRVSLVGKVDAVFVAERGRHRLVDWKTGELGDPDEQMGFYAMLWAVVHGELPLGVEAISVKTGAVHRAEPGWDDVGRVAAEVSEMVSGLRRAWEAGIPSPRSAGPWCRFCPILAECPEGQAAGVLLD
jgi:hypothetical protein